jgi:pyruvate/2-oxoglutarate dehydrogenase complex dihydrolipoamide dehydrogenase (E3) component
MHLTLKKSAFEEDGTEKSITGSHLVVAAGRTPNTEGLGLELDGVAEAGIQSAA